MTRHTDDETHRRACPTQAVVARLADLQAELVRAREVEHARRSESAQLEQELEAIVAQRRDEKEALQAQIAA